MTRALLLRPVSSAWLTVAVGVITACDDGTELRVPQKVSVGASMPRESSLGPFLVEHWRVPIGPQGEPPPEYSEAERSLLPATCGACHPKQYEEWKTSLHAGAFSPGFSGQLIEGDLADPFQIRSCQSCHAPLAEQQPFDGALEPYPDFDPELRSHGLICAGCHVRRHQYFGPPRRADLPPLVEPVPHAGFEVREEYLQSRFCAGCHQFFDDPGVNGKPIENTFAEWQESPQAAEGRHCQNCHMPDRAHLWRGIHDPDMVRAAVDVEMVRAEDANAGTGASLVLRNRDVGHAFPTYTTPRVFLAIFQTDVRGDELPGTRVEGTIGREVDFARGVEIFDTRVLPGESATLDYGLPRAEGAAALVGRVTVDPAHHYRGVFEYLLQRLESPRARALIEEAGRRALAVRYVLTEIRQPY